MSPGFYENCDLIILSLAVTEDKKPKTQRCSQCHGFTNFLLVLVSIRILTSSNIKALETLTGTTSIQLRNYEYIKDNIWQFTLVVDTRIYLTSKISSVEKLPVWYFLMMIHSS